MAAARPYLPSSGQQSTMTASQDESGYRNNSYGSRYASSTNRWKPHRKEQVETAMELIPADDEESQSRCSSANSSRPTSASSSRPGSSNSRRAPPISRPDSGSGRRTPSTPTKQVTLQAVARKPDRSEEEPERINWAEHRNLEEQRLRTSLSTENALCSGVDQLMVESGNNSRGPVTESEKLEIEDLEASDNTEESSSEDEHEAEVDEDVEIKAPNDLLMEFITCLQSQDYENGKKLCKMILMYEPDNPEAIKFQSLIDEKIDLDAEVTEGSDSDTDEDSSYEDSDEEGSGDSGDESSSESSSEEEEEEDSDEAKKDSIKAALEIP